MAVLNIIIFLFAAILCTSVILLLVAIFTDDIEDIAHNFWAARIAWKRGKEEYQDYIKSHK